MLANKMAAEEDIEQRHRLMLQNISRRIKIRNISLDMLKFALFDFVPIRKKLDDAKDAFDLFMELDNTGYIKPHNVTLLIALFKLLWLNSLNDIFFKPKFKIENVDPKDTFSSFRISIVNLSNKLQDDDIKEIAGVCAVPEEKSSNPWKLLQYLQDKEHLCKQNLMNFMKKTGLNKDFLEWHPTTTIPIQTESVDIILKPDEVESSDTAKPCSNLSRPEDNSHNRLHHLAHIDRPNEKLTESFDQAGKMLFDHGFHCDGIGNKCIIFHISSYDPKALKKLRKMCLNGQLLEKMSEILVIDKYKQQFLREWKTEINENQFNSAISKLMKKGCYDKLPPSHQPHLSQEEKIRKYLLERQQKLCSNYKKITPLITQSRFQLDIAHMFTDLELLKENIEGENKSKPITLKDVFKVIESKPACKVLIDGEGGIGKTTLLRYLAYNWSNKSDRSFAGGIGKTTLLKHLAHNWSKKSDKPFAGKIVFLVSIRDIRKGEDILDVILQQIPLNDFSRKTNLPKDSKLIEQFMITHDDEIVLMLDGLDELEKGSQSPISIFKREELQKSVVLLTTRSEKINEFIKESDVHIKVKGFSEDKINEYIKRYFENKSEKGVSFCKKFKKFNHPDLYSMCRNPMLLLLTCNMWEENQQIPADKADLFREVFPCIINQYSRQDIKPNKIFKLEDIPKEYVEAMCVLGKCMYNRLKKNQLSINKKDLEANEHVIQTALKLGFVYIDESVSKTDFKEIYAAPHKLIVESLVGYYFYKLCENSDEDNLPLLDNKEWEEIRENEHLENVREFAIGFLGANAGKFLKYWITNNLLTYRSLNLHINRVKQEHVGAVIQALTDHMANSEIEISDVCRSLRKFMYHNNPNTNVDDDENIILLVRKIHDTELRYQTEGFCNEMSPKEKGKILAHCIVAVKDQETMLKDIIRQFNDEVVEYFVAECEKLNIKYDISNYEFNAPTTASYLSYLLTHSPNLKRLSSNNECITGIVINVAMEMCSSRGINLKLKDLRISDNDLSSINATSLASIMNPLMSKLDIHKCNLTGKVINDMMTKCSGRGIKLRLRHLNISENDLRSINAKSLASIVSHQMSTLDMHKCNLTGDVLNDMMAMCSSRKVKFQFVNLYISDNDLNSINATSLASIVNPQMRILDMHNCNLTGDVTNDTMRECFNRRIKLQLVELDISDNDLSRINATSLASIINPQMKKLDMHNCNLTGDLFNNVMGKCREIKLKLVYLNISGNNLSSINARSLTSLLPSQLDISNCNIKGDLINETMKECYYRGIWLELKDLNISGNDLSSIDATSLASIMNFPMSSLDISNCNLTGEVINNMMIRRRKRRKIEMHLVYFNLSGNDLSSIDVQLLASLLPSRLDSLFRYGSTLDVHNCNLTGDVINDMIKLFSSKGIKLELRHLNISGNNISSIDATLLASTMNPQMKLLDMQNCN